MRRGRLMMLTLLALALPTSALAHDIEFSSGTFKSGSITSSFTNPFRVEVVGSMDTITLNIPSLTCFRTGTECFFTSGTVTVVNPAGVPLFTDGLEPGGIRIGTETASIGAYLLPDPMGTGGYAKFNVKFSSDTLLAGNAEVETAPDPSALEGLLLGTGILGLAEMTRRKLRLVT